MNKNRLNQNQKNATCAISGEPVAPAQAKCANIASNNTLYYTAKYHDIFAQNETSTALQNALLTCVCIGATIKTNITELTAYSTDLASTDLLYKVYFNNGIVLNLNGKNAQIKKYLNQLTTYKKAINKITYLDYKNRETSTESININPVYARQKNLFIYNKSYNPDSKKTMLKTW